jgi:NDP-sugar pyrophosphorylase family protein
MAKTVTDCKSMIKVAGRPILERLVLHLLSFGLKTIFVGINYKGHLIEEHFGDGTRFGCRIEYLRESEALGTGGAVALLSEKPLHPLVILNGDLVTQVNLERMLAFHTKEKFVATMGVRRYSHQVPFGCIEVNGNRIYRFEEKPVLERFINAGVYVLSPEAVARIPKKFFPITDLFEDSIERGDAVGAFEIQEDWIDVGHHAQLKKAQEGTP